MEGIPERVLSAVEERQASRFVHGRVFEHHGQDLTIVKIGVLALSDREGHKSSRSGVDHGLDDRGDIGDRIERTDVVADRTPGFPFDRFAVERDFAVLGNEACRAGAGREQVRGANRLAGVFLFDPDRPPGRSVVAERVHRQRQVFA